MRDRFLGGGGFAAPQIRFLNLPSGRETAEDGREEMRPDSYVFFFASSASSGGCRTASMIPYWTACSAVI